MGTDRNKDCMNIKKYDFNSRLIFFVKKEIRINIGWKCPFMLSKKYPFSILDNLFINDPWSK